MPIYEYKCNKCGVFEVVQKITDAPLKKCPTCKGKAERQISSTSFVLKGSGWYVTDYARKGSSGKSDSTESSSSDSSSTKESKDSSSGSSSGSTSKDSSASSSSSSSSSSDSSTKSSSAPAK
jgi:putative FmdB family regulatory protein